MKFRWTNTRESAWVALTALLLIWLGTFGMTFVSISEIAGARLSDSAGNEVKNSEGNNLYSRPGRAALRARHLCYVYAIPGFALISVGMALQVIEPFQTIKCKSKIQAETA